MSKMEELNSSIDKMVDELENEIVDTLLFELNDAQKKHVLETDTALQHFELGLYIRNRFIYSDPDGGQAISMLADPDDISMHVIEKIKKALSCKS